MHMADALISPAVGGIMLAAAAGTVARSIHTTHTELDARRVPLMGVMGAFVFTAQMINFAIPGTGSSGHLGGGLLLAALLGPGAGFLTLASVLLIQALFFGDGGLLAYGANLMNLGFWTCFVAYPLVFKPITRPGLSGRRIFTASMIASVVGLQFGALSVALETLLSGQTALPFGTFVLFMQPIHAVIGLVEGLVTAFVLSFVWKARPEILDSAGTGQPVGLVSLKKILIAFLFAAVLIGGMLSGFASRLPDGLEWAIERTTQITGSQIPSSDAFSQPSNNAVSMSGLMGGAVTLVMMSIIGLGMHWLRRFTIRKTPVDPQDSHE